MSSASASWDHGLVFYFTRVLPSYRYPVLERLNRRLGGNLVACAGEPPAGSSLSILTGPARHGFERAQMRNIWIRGETLHAQPFRHVFRTYGRPSVVMAEESPRSITLPLLLRYARRMGAARVLWGHFSSNLRTPSRWSLADRYRIALARSVDACVCYTEQIADIVRPHVEKQRIFAAPNTLDTDVLFTLHDALSAEGRTPVRRRLGLPHDASVLLFLGRLIRAKGTGPLLDAFCALRRRRKACLVVIGSGPEEAPMRVRVVRERIAGVHFLGAMPDWAHSAPYLYSADVLLNPGYLGLSVNHAFAFGLPVVSQHSPLAGPRFHSPEIAYLQSGHNGLLAAPNDPAALVQAVESVLSDRLRYASNALRYAREHLTIGRMVDGLEAAVRFAREGAGR